MLKMFVITIVVNLYSIFPLNAQNCMSMHVILNTKAGYITEAGEISGFHFDFLTALEEESGLCMDKILLPYSRAKRNIKIGAHDGGILDRSTSLGDDVEYIIRILTSKTVVIPGKGVSLNSYQDLSKITIARLRRGSLGHVLDSDTELLFVDVADYKHGLEMISRGRVDAIAGNFLGLSSTIESLNMLEEVNLSGKLIVSEREIWFVLSKKSNHLDKIAQLKTASQTLVDNGMLDNILEKYFGKHWMLVN